MQNFIVLVSLFDSQPIEFAAHSSKSYLLQMSPYFCLILSYWYFHIPTCLSTFNFYHIRKIIKIESHRQSSLGELGWFSSYFFISTNVVSLKLLLESHSLKLCSVVHLPFRFCCFSGKKKSEVEFGKATSLPLLVALYSFCFHHPCWESGLN